MNQQQTYIRTLHLSLAERISSLTLSTSRGRMAETTKLNTMLLAIEAHAVALAVKDTRMQQLKDYFENDLCTLLQNICQIDKLKEELRRRMYPLLSSSLQWDGDADFLSADRNLLDLDPDLQPTQPSATQPTATQLHPSQPTATQPSASQQPGSQQQPSATQQPGSQQQPSFPPLSASRLWNNSRTTKMQRAFYNAHEDLKKSPHHDLDSYCIRNAEYAEGRSISSIRKYRGLLLAAGQFTNQQIYDDLQEALEELRQAYMEQAHDIHCVRTGDPTLLPTADHDAYPLHYLYTQLPLEGYYEQRNEWLEELRYDLDQNLLDNWRHDHHLTQRPLSSEEYISFLHERQAAITDEMQKNYDTLWKLREHSGSYDTEVNTENFARMFYARPGTDRHFFCLQWELEYIDERIAAKQREIAAAQAAAEAARQQAQAAAQAARQQAQAEAQAAEHPARTPEQEAMEQLVTLITSLITTCHEKWHGRRITPYAHQPEVEIIIRKEELIDLLQQQLHDPQQPLLDHCYPHTNRTNRDICRYIAQLIDQHYFGCLPKNLIARCLAPALQLSQGTVTNYLSPK